VTPQSIHFTLEHARVQIKNRASLHARAEIAEGALGGTKGDLDVDAKVRHSSSSGGIQLRRLPGLLELEAA
jgi:hypothetical protein